MKARCGQRKREVEPRDLLVKKARKPSNPTITSVRTTPSTIACIQKRDFGKADSLK
jgi:hypothetical protein